MSDTHIRGGVPEPHDKSANSPEIKKERERIYNELVEMFGGYRPALNERTNPRTPVDWTGKTEESKNE